MSTAPTSSDLGRVVTSATTRRAIYGTYVVLLVIAGAVTIAFATLGGLPQWVGVMNAVLGYLGIPVAGLAAVNVTAGDEPVADRGE